MQTGDMSRMRCCLFIEWDLRSCKAQYSADLFLSRLLCFLSCHCSFLTLNTLCEVQELQPSMVALVAGLCS